MGRTQVDPLRDMLIRSKGPIFELAHAGGVRLNGLKLKRVLIILTWDSSAGCEKLRFGIDIPNTGLYNNWYIKYQLL